MKFGGAGVLTLLLPCLLLGQGAGVVLSGTVTGPSGAVVGGAKVSIKSVTTGQSTEVTTNSAGLYTAPNLFAGQYEISISAEGYSPKQVGVTIATGSRQTVDVALAAGLGNAGTPTLGDLGFPTNSTQGSAQDQAKLDRRSHMLQMHQRLGLITAAPLVATLITSALAGGRHSTSTGRDIHATLGSVTVGMYLWTASYAIRAPRIEGTRTRGPIRVHKALAWVHGTGMILTPILGAMALDQKDQGEKVHGIASAHGAAAWVTGLAYGAAIVSVSFKF